jgi:histidine triad (HIT) family protein
MPSVFTRIIMGEIPSHRIYEDALVVGFLDIAPLSPGHALLVPREERAMVHELSDASAAALGAALPRVARALLGATGATAYNVLINNGALAHQEVPHVHAHIIPRLADGQGLRLDWRAGTVDHARAADLAARVRALLAGA